MESKMTDEELKSAITGNIMQQLLENKRIDNARRSLDRLRLQMKELEKELESRTELVRPI